MAEKLLYSRLQQKHDTEANWLKATNFTPLQGELIVYDADENYNYARVKIGDGVTNVNELPFISPQVDQTLTIEGAAADAKAVGNALVKSVADWNEADETSLAFIKNKPTEETEDDAFEMLVEMGIIIPVTDDENNIFADEDGTIFTV